jgi:hypothetical protein
VARKSTPKKTSPRKINENSPQNQSHIQKSPEISCPICHNHASMRTPLQIAASKANGAKSQGPRTPEGKQIAAANSAKSTGPVTPEGKAIVSRNATRHGLLADSILLPGESEEAFFAVLAWLEKKFQPKDEFEDSLIETAAMAHWRRQRACTLEKAQHIRESRKLERAAAGAGDDTDDENCDDAPIMKIEASFRSLADTSNTAVNLGRYETCHRRAFQAAIKFLDSRRALEGSRKPSRRAA